MHDHIYPVIFETLIDEIKTPLVAFDIDPTRYLVSNHGYVESRKRGRVKEAFSSSKIPTVGLVNIEGEKKTYRLDAIIATTFCNNPNPDIYTRVIHKDGIIHECASNNLNWVTPEYQLIYNKYNKQEDVKPPREIREWYGPKLDEDTVRLIREFRNHGFTKERVREILKLDISDSTLRSIYSENSWVGVNP